MLVSHQACPSSMTSTVEMDAIIISLSSENLVVAEILTANQNREILTANQNRET